MSLSKLWVDILDNEATLEAVNISGTYNSLSRLKVLGNEWSKDQQKSFKSLIVKLAEKGKGIYKEFDSWAIANILNALSKWNVLNSAIWTGTVQTEEGKEVTKVQLFKNFIVNLAEQGIQSSTQFNSQHIANTFNALSKLDVFHDSRWEGHQETFKDLIVNLAKQGIQSSTQFNSQDIANTFNAFSKLNILGNKWISNEQEELKSLIVKLAERGSCIEGYNLKGIAKIYSALLKWSNDGWNTNEFKSLTAKLKEQVQAIAQKQNEEDNILDNIRFTSQIITDLPKLKLKNLITSESKMLVPLMECLSTSIDKSGDSDLKGNKPKENILSGLKGFVNIINELEDKSNLRGKFDQSLITIFKKLSKLGSEYNNKISEIITNKLMGLEVIEDKDALQKLLVGQSEDKGLERKMGNLEISNVGQSNEPGTALNGATRPVTSMNDLTKQMEKLPTPVRGRGVGQSKEENKPGSGATLRVQPFSGKDGSISGSSQLPKKQEREEEKKVTNLSRPSHNPNTSMNGSQIEKLTTPGRGRGRGVGQLKKENKPGSGATF